MAEETVGTLENDGAPGPRLAPPLHTLPCARARSPQFAVAIQRQRGRRRYARHASPAGSSHWPTSGDVMFQTLVMSADPYLRGGIKPGKRHRSRAASRARARVPPPLRALMGAHSRRAGREKKVGDDMEGFIAGKVRARKEGPRPRAPGPPVSGSPRNALPQTAAPPPRPRPGERATPHASPWAGL